VDVDVFEQKEKQRRRGRLAKRQKTRKKNKTKTNGKLFTFSSLLAFSPPSSLNKIPHAQPTRTLCDTRRV
jgi:hypothetical protein